MPNNETNSKTVKSVETALSILEALEASGGATITELADRLDMSPGAVHHHLSTFRQHQYVVKRGGTYHIGLQFLAFGGKARETEDIYQLGKNRVDILTEKTGYTARLVVERSGYAITVYQSLGTKKVPMNTHVGSRFQLHTTAAGKALLAHYSRDQVEKILEDRGLEEITPNTTTERSLLYEELEEIQKTGIAYDYGERFENTQCVASPIRRDGGGILGAVSLSAPSHDVDDEWFHDEAATLVRNTTGSIGVQNTYASWL